MWKVKQEILFSFVLGFEPIIELLLKQWKIKFKIIFTLLENFHITKKIQSTREFLMSHGKFLGFEPTFTIKFYLIIKRTN